MSFSLPSAMLERSARTLAIEVVEGLTMALVLDRPSAYRFCAILLPALRRFLITVHEVSLQRQETLASTLRSKYGDVLDVYAAFANSIWTDEEISNSEKCKCEHCGVEEIKDDYIQLEDANLGGLRHRPLQEFIFQVFLMLDSIALDVGSNSVSAIKLEKKDGKHRKWPSSPSKFIPQGALTAASAFARWAKVVENIAPINTLFRLTNYCPSLIAAIAEEEALLPLIRDLFCQFVNIIREAGPNNMNERRLNFIRQELIRFRGVFASIWLVDLLPSRDGVFAKNNTHILTSIYNATCDLVPLLGMFAFATPIKEQITSTFMTLGVAIHGCSTLTPFPLPLHSSLAPSMLEFDSARGKVGFGQLLSGATHLRNQRRCSDLSCDQTGEETRTNFKICGSCKVARYCSKECQLSDWTEHKKVCRSLKTIQTLSINYHRGNININPTDARKPESDVINEKLRQSSGMTEEQIRDAHEYLNQRALLTRNLRNH